jgi:hypothetical protein
MFSIDVSAHLDAKRLAGEALERRRVTGGGPELQLGVSRRPQLQQIVVAAVVKLETGDGLRVAAIQAFRQPQQRGERTDDAARAARQFRESFMAPLGSRLAMIAGHQRDRFDLLRLESAEIAVFDQVIRVLVMILVADVNADVVKNG